MQNRIVEIAKDGVHVGTERGFLIVSRKRQTLGRVPLDDIAGLVVRGYGASLSTAVCGRLAERNVPVVICGADQSPASVVWPVSGHHMQGFIMQGQALAKKPLLKRLWAQLVRAKINAQSATLRAAGREAGDLTAMARRVRSGDPGNVEAQSAQRYWPRLFGSGFRRDRSGKGVNAALNYGYTVLRTAMSRSIIAAGLHPSLSIQHRSRGDALRLSDDLMEPFRPHLDWIVWKLARAGTIKGALDVEAKAELVRVLSLDLDTRRGASPVQVCMDRLAQSLVTVYAGDRAGLELPGEPVFLDVEGER